MHTKRTVLQEKQRIESTKERQRVRRPAVSPNDRPDLLHPIAIALTFPRASLQFLFPGMSGTKPTVVQDQGLEWFCGGAANNPRQASGAVGRVPDIWGDKPLALPQQKPRVCELSAVFLGADD